MEAMHTAYAQSGTWFSHIANYTRQTITEGTRVLWKESVHRLWRTVYFTELFDEPGSGGKGPFETRHSFLYFFSLVHISDFFKTNFESTCVWCMHLLKSWCDPCVNEWWITRMRMLGWKVLTEHHNADILYVAWRMGSTLITQLYATWRSKLATGQSSTELYQAGHSLIFAWS